MQVEAIHTNYFEQSSLRGDPLWKAGYYCTLTYDHYTHEWILEKLYQQAESDKGENESHHFARLSQTPPDLKGPLHVDFNFKVNLDDMRKKYSSILQKGGQYKPPNCKSRHKVAVIIPFRNRYEHLDYWLYYLHPILMRQQLDYGLFIINQDGNGVFNRAKLMNVGFGKL
ncbi:hypothetical protein WMY93_029725 [Mugilogobius chulae]|uniref:Galactosyltransferase N-terminal domain-containing protein n=1 Tax=Mugilogobius chulae TaxID=88201 RepID=A0AAW0MXH5_9GOBI